MIDPVAAAPARGRPADDGLSELLALPDGRLLALERSGADLGTPTWAFAAKLYEVDVSGATDVNGRAALTDADGKYEPAAKRLVVDFNQLGQPHVDCIEGMAWGRSGCRTATRRWCSCRTIIFCPVSKHRRVFEVTSPL